jgi:hypothetical protein
MNSRQNKLPVEFHFAGFPFPRYIAELKTGTKKERQERYKYTGGYYTAPRPGNDGKGFYLDDSLRWKWCDNISRSISHTGWFCDEFQDSKMRGIVVLLSHSRYLAGWSMGEGMASEISYDLYTDEEEAARAADSMAENAAEKEREYQDEENRLQDEEEANQGADEEETESY